jgi:hypothetical protein
MNEHRNTKKPEPSYKSGLGILREERANLVKFDFPRAERMLTSATDKTREKRAKRLENLKKQIGWYDEQIIKLEKLTPKGTGLGVVRALVGLAYSLAGTGK